MSIFIKKSINKKLQILLKIYKIYKSLYKKLYYYYKKVNKNK